MVEDVLYDLGKDGLGEDRMNDENELDDYCEAAGVEVVLDWDVIVCDDQVMCGVTGGVAGGAAGVVRMFLT